MVESIHAVIQEGSAAEEPSWAWHRWGPKFFCGRAVVIDPDSPVGGSSAANFCSLVTFYALVCNVVACS